MVKVIALLKKREGMSVGDFIAYYENFHYPLGMRLFPEMKRHIRNYCTGEAGRATGALGAVDCITEVYFDTVEDRDTMFRRMAEDPELERELSADEERLFDRSAIRVLFVEESEVELPTIK
ncbi:EthD domain-containing protein [Sphingobium lactosutens]|uniref:EthD domain-containing protein n=1 Tax=Sphingobium lactosutens TaxID=522773 RepID=UPI0015BDB11C|nr:EthD domain-containing protein [Sphingobium lactosutens]